MKEAFCLIGILLYLRGVTVIFSLHHTVILEAVQTTNNKVKEKFFDVKYKNGDLIESKYDDGKSVIKTIYKKYDSFGNWLEADIYYNHDGNCSFTIFRDIEYYE